MTPDWHEQVAQLYHAALELEPARRAAYLAEACGGDESLRQEVASLLGYAARSGGLIDRSAPEAAAQAMAEAQIGLPAESLIGQQIGHCRVLSLLGRGGMGEVWLAEDAELGRKVAVKLLPVEFATQPERVRRFAQEARAASALNHPNIITIHEIGQASTKDGGTHYIVTEYVEGETLRRRLANAPAKQMKPEEAIETAAQIAAALAAAHEAGITHRDVKPENVMVRRDGIVKVLDFGLAKLTEPSAPVVDTQASTAPGVSTEAGVVMGTPRYMSPEQARGEKVDARTDIFSLGVMLYEMIAGRAPFVGATVSEIIAAILRDSPPPLILDAPPELERIIHRALRKDRDERYQTAKALLGDLNQLKERLLVEKFVVPPSGGSVRRRELPPEGGTTNKRRLAAIVALAGLVIVAIATWFYFNRAPVLTSQDIILLADFENRTGDAVFDGTLKQGLAIQLRQSPFLNLFPEPLVRQTLREMKRPPDARVTAAAAREICERHNLKALIAGSIAPLGSHYVITLEAINGQSGESLMHEQVAAESREQVLQALSQAATQLRGKLGESLGSIQRFDKPLKQATTSKLEAFKAWSLGIERSYSGNMMEAIPFYKRAVEIDPEFALAYNVLSQVHWATGRLGLAGEYAEKGYKLKDRVSEFEKLRITNFYYAYATGDLNKRIEVLLLLKGSYPRDSGAPTDLALTYNLIGQYDQAVAEAREAIRLNRNFAPAHRALGWALLPLNRFAEARDALTQALQQQLDTPDFHAILYQIAFMDGDTAAMQQQLDWTRGRPNEYIAFDWQTGAAAFAGQWRKAQDFSQLAIDLAARGDTKEVAARYATEQALRGAATGDCREARADAVQGLKLARGRTSLPRAALARVLCGEANPVRSLIDEMTKLYPEDTVINSLWLPTIRAAIDLQHGNATRAIEQLQAASRYEAAAEFWPQYLRGQAYLKLRRGAEAATEFQKILDHRGYGPLSPLYPLAHLGLARAAAMAGDTAKSWKAYEDFLAVWKEADADLPILREAKQEYELAAKR